MAFGRSFLQAYDLLCMYVWMHAYGHLCIQQPQTWLCIQHALYGLDAPCQPVAATYIISCTPVTPFLFVIIHFLHKNSYFTIILQYLICNGIETPHFRNSEIIKLIKSYQKLPHILTLVSKIL